MVEFKNKKIKIIAGPCSLNKENLDDIYKIAQIRVNNKRAVWGVRTVGLKSRTNFDKRGYGMGIDFNEFLVNLNKVFKSYSLKDLEIYKSVSIIRKIIEDTKLLVATEIMDPLLQLSVFQKYIPTNKFLIWNPAVQTLGCQILLMSKFARKNKWYLGIKNPKWLGDYLNRANNPKYKERTSMEKTWEGLASYAKKFLSPKRIILIHRGVDIPEKENYRNAPVHWLAMRVKKHTNCSLFFDPSHSHGPKMRENIVEETIKAMKMKINKDEYLYDGILIEVGKSMTDTEQHISIGEFEYLVKELSKFRSF